ncbi:amidase signature domain-containing protein [Triangularia setosa]|uniref:Amidase signature domain-containing protein n=1 Tax=Triangularia setosa TaxID=2587417 RepID=A0AAN7A9U1_9PEZI|nr:amidase signature domain-containing protein [Podospora setosa]
MLVSPVCKSIAFTAAFSWVLQHGHAAAAVPTSSSVQRNGGGTTTIITSGTVSEFPSLLNAEISDLIEGLDSGLFTSIDLVKAYIARINEVNSTLKAVTQINPDALSIAANLDAARAAGTNKGPLHGIPILLKDNIATFDKMENTAGSYALVGAKVPEDSTVAAKLRQAGAIILGKTNLSQWANFRSFNSSNGWSSTGGQTEGAYFQKQDPSGSSSGSGVASSLGLAAASLGTETHGSILSPAQINNLVGIKPTVGLTSRYLVVPISERQDTIGPMARTVKDAAYLLAAISGKDLKDNYTSSIPFSTVPDYVSACQLGSLSGKRIGIPRNLIPNPPSASFQYIISTFTNALNVLRQANATIIDDLYLPGQDLMNLGPYQLHVMNAEFISDLPKYFASLTSNPANLTGLHSLINWTKSHPHLEHYPERDVVRWEAALNITGHGNDSPYFWGNYSAQVYAAGPQGILGALKNHSLDALVLPTWWSPTMPALVGTPVVTVPLGKLPNDGSVVEERDPFGELVHWAGNLPFGISFVGEGFSEEKLIGLAYDFEQKTKVREAVEVYIKPKTELRDVVAERLQKQAAKTGGRYGVWERTKSAVGVF